MKAKKGKPYHNNRISSKKSRLINTRETSQRFLIVCEGGKTEPNYFRKFRLSIDIEPLGLGYNTVSLVEKTIELMTKDYYDQVWCVFDKDDFPNRDFNQAIFLANRHGIRVAYSNEAFELWYCLHFEYLHTGIPRKDYYEKLSGYLGKEYDKTDEDLYENLLAYQSDAFRNATRLLSLYNLSNPAKEKPSTTVHLLVEELNKYSIDR